MKILNIRPFANLARYEKLELLSQAAGLSHNQLARILEMKEVEVRKYFKYGEVRGASARQHLDRTDHLLSLLLQVLQWSQYDLDVMSSWMGPDAIWLSAEYKPPWHPHGLTNHLLHMGPRALSGSLHWIRSH